ncbi:MAG TPA: protein kinase [Polyangiaceae bacterium]|nr:protein kinase [Polyangiaceae bacterium]
MNTLAIDTLPELSLPDADRKGRSLPPATLLESTVRMRERADCPVAMGELLAGKYELERVVGIGGMGVVVLAWHAELQQRVALKLLRESFSGHVEARERFRREARAAARISSDHVVRVFDVATLDNGVPYMVMEYLEGQSLRDLLHAVGPLEEHEVASIMLQVCDALAEAHHNQIVHRDLKPENIYLTHRPHRPPLVKVLDFGVSKSLASNTVPHLKLTPASMLRGSPSYMSPEQLDCKRDFDARSDIWGAGVLIFELLTRHLPFQGETLPQIICAVLAGERLPLSHYRPGSSPAMEAVLGGCLAPEPDDRFRTVQRLAQALRPLAVAPDDWATRLRQHLAPSAAAADAYGKAHIVGESCTADSSFLQATELDLPAAPTLSCDAAFAAAPFHWPSPPAIEPSPPVPKRKPGHALVAAAAGACVAALVVCVLIWARGEAPGETSARISAASPAHLRTPTLRSAPAAVTPAPGGAATLSAPAKLRTPELAPQPSVRTTLGSLTGRAASEPPVTPGHAPAPPNVDSSTPAHTGPARALRPPRPAAAQASVPVASPDAVPLSDFGGRL